MEDDLDQALILYGWDEVGMFDHEFDLANIWIHFLKKRLDNILHSDILEYIKQIIA